MKIKIDQKDLAKHISIAQKGISSRTTLQILEGILIQTINNKLKLVSTDLEISMETYVSCEVIEQGAIVVNSKIFGDIIRKLPQGSIYIEVDSENNIKILCENSEFNLVGYSPADYPDLPMIKEENFLEIPSDLFKSAIRQTVFATIQDETRPSLKGVLMESDGDMLSFVALDGYRLALRKIGSSNKSDIKIIIPGRALNEINKILEDDMDNIKIISSKSDIIFNLGSTIMYSRLLEGQFFNYKDIIRKDHKTSLVVNRRDFQDSLERASLLAKEEKANLIKMRISDSKATIKSNSEIGNVNEVVPGKQEGEDVNIAFNSRYILEGVKTIEAENIKLNFTGSLNPCIINPLEDDNYTYLVLPVRLANEDF